MLAQNKLYDLNGFQLFPVQYNIYINIKNCSFQNIHCGLRSTDEFLEVVHPMSLGD
jgi:hypothetical protein